VSKIKRSGVICASTGGYKRFNRPLFGRSQCAGQVGCAAAAQDAGRRSEEGIWLSSVARPRESHGRRVFAECSGETAKGPAAARSAALAFQPHDGRWTNSGLISQVRL